MMLTLTADYDEDNIDDYDRLMELSEGGGQETAWNDYRFDMISFFPKLSFSIYPWFMCVTWRLIENKWIVDL